MLKYYDHATTFTEFPDEIALCVNITNCPGNCEQCSEPWLLKDQGTELSNHEIDVLISKHPHITLFGLMGGDVDHADCVRIFQYIKSKYPDIKTGMYSGQEYIDINIIPYIDYYKIGRWIVPKGDQSIWYKTNCGPMNFPWSNQLMFKKVNNKLINITNEFRKNPLGDLNRYILNQ